MQLSELKKALRSHPGKSLRFVLADGAPIPADFHVTEVGHLRKNFIDCGGTVHSTDICVLQVWVARNGGEHRLTTGKLASILELAGKVVPSDDVEVEYEASAVSLHPVMAAETSGAELAFTLGTKHTDCLAREACGLESRGEGPGETGCCRLL
jgi:uncharacterized protein DUF6428